MSTRLRLLVVTALILSCFHLAPGDAQAQGNSPLATATPHVADMDELATRVQDALKAGKFEDAARLCRQLVKQRPQSAEAWGYLAASLYNLNRYPEARDAYRHTTILTPKNGPSWAYLGLCEYDMRDYPHAFGHLAKGEKLGLGDDRDLTANVKYHLAILWDTAGQFDRGLLEMQWFAQQNLGSQDIFEAFGLSVLRRPWFPYEIPADKLPILVAAGEASFAESVHKPEEARKLYEALVAQYGNEPNIHYAYGKFLANLDIDAALNEYQKELKITPAHVPVRIDAAFLCLKAGKLEEGLSYAQQAAKIEPKNPVAHNLTGKILVALDRTTEAVPELALAARLVPQSPSFHLDLARAYQKVGDKALSAKEMATFNQLESKKVLPPAPSSASPQ